MNLDMKEMRTQNLLCYLYAQYQKHTQRTIDLYMTLRCTLSGIKKKSCSRNMFCFLVISAMLGAVTSLQGATYQ